MKRLSLFLILLLIVNAGLNTVMAQGTIIIVPPPSPTPVPDTDGDGLPDTDDLCPTVPGTRDNRGCPVTIPNPPADSDGDGIPDPNDACPTVPGTQANQGCPVTTLPDGNPPPNEPAPGSASPDARPDVPPPFVPPRLPTDGCYVTPFQDSRVNVRSAPDLSASIIGNLLPGRVYPSLGYVMNGTDMWFVLTVYEGSTGTTGYASRSVLTASLCAEVPDDVTVPTGAADDFAPTPLDLPTLCYLSVGYDPAYWGSSFDPALGNEPAVYASFYFERAPGQPISAGTPIWGVVSINGYHLLPPESPLFFQDPDNAVAVASNQSVIDAAKSGGVGMAFNLAFPSPNGGVMATNGTIFYRLSAPTHVGNCGPIVAIDDLASVPAQGDSAPVLADGLGSSIYEFAFSDPDLACEDDLSVWWIQVDNPFRRPLEFLSPDAGTCALFDAVPINVGMSDSSVRLIRGGSSQVPFRVPNNLDCDNDGTLDRSQYPFPTCLIDQFAAEMPDMDRDKEYPDWWRQVLDLTCSGGWLMMLEIDADGEEVVTDAQCDD